MFARKHTLATDNRKSMVEILESFRNDFAGLSPAKAPAVDGRLASDLRYHAWYNFRQPDPHRRRVAKEYLDLRPDLKFQLLCHPDGFVRAAALENANEELASPFSIALIIWRMNDWVNDVRLNAVACLRRCLPMTDGSKIAVAVAGLIVPAQSWQRWGSDALLQEILSTVPGLGGQLSSELAGDAYRSGAKSASLSHEEPYSRHGINRVAADGYPARCEGRRCRSTDCGKSKMGKWAQEGLDRQTLRILSLRAGL